MQVAVSATDDEFARVAKAVSGIPYMSLAQGRRLFEHLQATGAQDVLEIGTAHGVSAAYMAAAVAARAGRVTTIDHIALAHRNPSPEHVLARAGLSDTVTLVRVPDSSYTWWLKDRVAERSDRHGNCHPVYDFCYLDGAHNWTIDGLSVILIEKLLRPGGWLLLDDLHWTYALGEGGSEQTSLSPAERRVPHMYAVFELLVCQHPNFSEFIEEDAKWGWARKCSTERRYTIRMSSSWQAQIASGALRMARRAAADVGLRLKSRPDADVVARARP